jgi:HSP20 family protein
MVRSQKGGEDMTTMVRLSPFRELEAMERRMRPFLEGFTLAPAVLPAADIYETDDEYVVELEVPGFEQEELGIQVFDHQLVVKGERKKVEDRGEKAFRVHERLEQDFERRFALPREAETEHARATFHTGVLEVRTPKAIASKPKKVEIKKA